MSALRHFISSIADLLIILVALDLLIDPKYGFGIYLIFGLFVPIKMVMILTDLQFDWKKKLVFLLSPIMIIILSLFWARYDTKVLLYLIIGVAIFDFVMDINFLRKAIQSILKR